MYLEADQELQDLKKSSYLFLLIKSIYFVKILIGGQKSFSLSADGLMDFATGGTDTELDELFTQMLARTPVTFIFGRDDASLYNMSGSGIITSIEVSGGTEDAPTYSVSIEGTGTLTVG